MQRIMLTIIHSTSRTTSTNSEEHMSTPQVGDTRTIQHPGHIPKRIGNETRRMPGTVVNVQQTFTETKRMTILGKTFATLEWVDTAFVD